jgi:hypothetical protein
MTSKRPKRSKLEQLRQIVRGLQRLIDRKILTAKEVEEILRRSVDRALRRGTGHEV